MPQSTNFQTIGQANSLDRVDFRASKFMIDYGGQQMECTFSGIRDIYASYSMKIDGQEAATLLIRFATMTLESRFRPGFVIEDAYVTKWLPSYTQKQKVNGINTSAARVMNLDETE